jgi:hypothetical protein
MSRDLEHLAGLARDGALESLDENGRRRSRQAFMARVDEALTEPPRRRWHYFAVPALAVAAAVALFVALPRGLSYEVNGAIAEGGYVRAPATRHVEVKFSDATTVTASAGSRLRVEGTTANGARVLLERGSTEVAVVHQADSAWTFVAGPFEVQVTGTRFALAWDPAKETVDLVLHEGSVEVRGFAGSGPVAVRSGQRFRGDALQRSMAVMDASASTTPAPAPSDSVALPASPLPALEPSALEPLPKAPVEPHSPPAGESWQKLTSQGKFDRIVSEATARGIPACLQSCSAADLRSLADAARYTGRSELAEQSLLSLRKRFAADAGRGAAFLLGRLYEGRGSTAQARTWYEAYLRESPGGDFAAEALAGKMRTVNALEGRKSAEPIAREYLRRYPTGVHAKTARRIAEAD